MAAKARDSQASFTTYMAEDRWRVLRRDADAADVSRSSILEALEEYRQGILRIRPGADFNAAILSRAGEITQERRRRFDG